jgi:hypothetical protein
MSATLLLRQERVRVGVESLIACCLRSPPIPTFPGAEGKEEEQMENDQEFNAKEFLNPNSMLTPGFAGGMTMGITNTIATQFEFFHIGPPLANGRK